ncbi:MAG TPA: DUF2905 domain-containing protein [Chloroflexi bacterium]|nr:DUF2905 domain-containing protein [Chloroflexota bacterium]
MEGLGRTLLITGGAIVLLGLIFFLAGRIPFLGRLPGDIRIEGDRVSCFIPLTSMILLSLLLTVIINVILRIMNR